MTTRTKARPAIPDADRDEAARLIWDGYLNFLIGGPAPGEEADPKLFAGRHAAGRAALSHLDQLYKVTGAAGGDAAAGEAAAGHLGAARAGIASLDGEGAEADDDAGDG